MAGTVTGFQRPFTFIENATYKTVGMEQAVVYGANPREVQVPLTDNLVPVGVVTYQFEDRSGGSVSVQLDRIVEVTAAEDISFGEDVIVAAGGKAKRAAGLSAGTKANVLGEAHNDATAGQLVQVLIAKKRYTI